MAFQEAYINLRLISPCVPVSHTCAKCSVRRASVQMSHLLLFFYAQFFFFFPSSDQMMHLQVMPGLTIIWGIESWVAALYPVLLTAGDTCISAVRSISMRLLSRQDYQGIRPSWQGRNLRGAQRLSDCNYGDGSGMVGGSANGVDFWVY